MRLFEFQNLRHRKIDSYEQDRSECHLRAGANWTGLGKAQVEIQKSSPPHQMRRVTETKESNCINTFCH